MRKTVSVLLLSLFVSACGGSGSDKEEEKSVTEEHTSTTTPPPAEVSKFSAIAGVYDASYNSDKAIVLITTAGQYRVFDDLNDSLGNNKTCYAKPSATTPNSQYDGLSFEFDDNSRHFNLKDANPSLAFEVDENDKLTYIIYGGSITVGGGGFTIGSAENKVVISRQKLALTESDVLDNQCQ
ncbi:hypothetical protein ACSLBF_18755 (plasmid) [Pseudoalteromonas sp. T1lg65]|uniref:hypothetical protein n=1 Tax=Pseudoalteromonas sp. T1lg65 TaxID=2077101 RepID=UPI003F79FC5D